MSNPSPYPIDHGHTKRRAADPAPARAQDLQPASTFENHVTAIVDELDQLSRSLSSLEQQLTIYSRSDCGPDSDEPDAPRKNGDTPAIESLIQLRERVHNLNIRVLYATERLVI